ncbi:MAG: hypothetical protein R3B35_14535 [Gemmatimonadales bacterium]
MTPDEMQDLARALEKVPGLKGIDMRDVRRLAQLLHDHPELGSIELKGFFGTGVVITRTSHGMGGAPMYAAAPPRPRRRSRPRGGPGGRPGARRRRRHPRR